MPSKRAPVRKVPPNVRPLQHFLVTSVITATMGDVVLPPVSSAVLPKTMEPNIHESKFSLYAMEDNIIEYRPVLYPT